METQRTVHNLHDETETERGSAEGQALVEYSLVILLIAIGALATLYTFQDAVINRLWGMTSILVDAMTKGS